MDEIIAQSPSKPELQAQLGEHVMGAHADVSTSKMPLSSWFSLLGNTWSPHISVPAQSTNIDG